MSSLQLIPREELKLECHDTGRQLESKIFAKHPSSLSPEEMDEVFTPLIDSIQEKTEKAINRMIDEEKGLQKDYEEREEKESLISSRRGTLSETVGKFVVVSEDGSHERSWEMCDNNFINGLHRAWKDGWEGILSYENVECGYLYDVDDNEFLSHDEDDFYWQDYLPEIRVTLKDPYHDLIGLTEEGFIDYLKRHQMTLEQIEKLIDPLNRYYLLKYTYYLNYALGIIGCINQKKCQMVIRRGSRQGRLCDRPCGVGKNKCGYHIRKQQYNPY